MCILPSSTEIVVALICSVHYSCVHSMSIHCCCCYIILSANEIRQTCYSFIDIRVRVYTIRILKQNEK